MSFDASREQVASRHRASLAAALIAGALSCAVPAAAQTETIIASLGHGHGRFPMARLFQDKGGNLFGTAELGGKSPDGFGAVFELVNHGSSWNARTIDRLNLFDGGFPEAGVIAHDDALFGTTGLGAEGCGMVFQLTRKPVRWGATTLHTFGGSDGCVPVGELAVDAGGNLYGSTGIGGAKSEGAVFEMTPSGKSWTYQVIYSFQGGSDGNRPQGILLDPDGTIFGTAAEGGTSNDGAIFQLVNSNGAWTETLLHSFGGNGDGSGPSGGLAGDGAGNLYGSTTAGGAHESGTVYELSPSGKGWTETVLYSFTGGADGNVPIDGITWHKGVLYGATASGGKAGGGGTVFKLVKNNGAWAETVLHAFPASSTSDGVEPVARPIVDSTGVIYGTTLYGGDQDRGTVYSIVE